MTEPAVSGDNDSRSARHKPYIHSPLHSDVPHRLTLTTQYGDVRTIQISTISTSTRENRTQILENKSKQDRFNYSNRQYFIFSSLSRIDTDAYRLSAQDLTKNRRATIVRAELVVTNDNFCGIIIGTTVPDQTT